jgi:peptidoglycan/LPS O-acetylase OafA/YrhL
MQHNDTPQRLDVLDGLRGLAVLLVVWYHLWLVSGFVFPLAGPQQLFVESGFLGVDVFFFVSGFCIAYPYARARANERALPTWQHFARRRALKIVPSYLVALVVFASVYAWKFASANDLIASLLAHLAFVHVWFPATFGSISGPLWTIGVEVQFYVLFALVARYVVRRPLLAFLASAVVAECYRATLSWTGNDTDFGLINQLPAVLDVFGAGVLTASIVVGISRSAHSSAATATADPVFESLIAQLARRLSATSPATRRFRAMQASACAVAAIVVVILGYAAITTLGRVDGIDAVHRALDAARVAFGPTLAVLTLGIAFGARPLHDAFALPVLRGLSRVSYNAYLWNLEVAVSLQALGLPAWRCLRSAPY